MDINLIGSYLVYTRNRIYGNIINVFGFTLDDIELTFIFNYKLAFLKNFEEELWRRANMSFCCFIPGLLFFHIECGVK